MTTATMDDLRQQLQTTEQAEKLRKEKLFIQLAKRLADGENVSADELKAAGIVSIQTAKMVCPECSSDTCRAIKTAGQNQSCICDGCGHSWKQPVPDELPEGCRPFGDLEAAVAQIHQRRAWKSQLEKLPEQRSQLNRLQAEQQRLEIAVEKAIKARDDFAKQIESELFNLRRNVAEADSITELIIRSCDVPELKAEKRELDRQSSIVVRELETLGTHLWGYSTPGTFSSVVRDSFGEQILTKLQAIVSVSGLYEVARKHYPEHFSTVPLVDRKTLKTFGEWLSPDSEAFACVIKAELPRSEREAALKAYRALYVSKVKPMVGQWVQAHLNRRDVDAQISALLQRMLEA